MYDAVLRPLDDCPVVSRELPGVVNHGTERCAAFEFGWCPGVPIADGVHRSVEVDLVHLAGAIIGVGVVPEQASFLRHFVRGLVCDNLEKSGNKFDRS